MRRIDVIGIGVGILVAGIGFYGAFQWFGLDQAKAGIWTQALLVLGLVGWLLTYVVRAMTGSMTYHQQRQDYEDAVLQKRLDQLTSEELEKLQAEIEAERSPSNSGQS